jgi:hypothetical protein
MISLIALLVFGFLSNVLSSPTGAGLTSPFQGYFQVSSKLNHVFQFVTEQELTWSKLGPVDYRQQEVPTLGNATLEQLQYGLSKGAP